MVSAAVTGCRDFYFDPNSGGIQVGLIPGVEICQAPWTWRVDIEP